MKQAKIHNNDCQIYPGGYVPLMNEDELQEEIKHSFERESILPPVTTTELEDSYIVELTIPGINREDFLIHADDNVLSVCILHKDSGLPNIGETTTRGFNYGLFNRSIQLPPQADAAFISAEYNAGTLRLYMPKTSRPVKHLHNTIVVY
ncbi:MAG: Hsp20/alpha crystallin family protein [Chitinophagaceae bacterium]|nr:Hsp20/alpha crystallin family protein [Chitinophagaceae bacterium]